MNLEHRDDPVRAADEALMLRRVVQSVARQFGLQATFMSKPFADQAGSGLHVHASMLDGDGQNIFDDRRADGATMLGHAAAGLQATMAEGMAFFAPNLNVYRRFRANNFTPVTRDWAENNRSAAFRVPPSTGAARRLEHRIAARSNPYLVIAAVLAGMHHGIEEGSTPDRWQRGTLARRWTRRSATLWDALRATRGATILPRWMGKDYPHLRGREGGRVRLLLRGDLDPRIRVVSLNRPQPRRGPDRTGGSGRLERRPDRSDGVIRLRGVGARRPAPCRACRRRPARRARSPRHARDRRR